MATKKAEEKTKPAEERRFEDSLKRLESIVKAMEEGSLSLEDMIAHFEEGQGLIKFCTEKLNEVKRRVEILVKKGNKVEARPFAEADDEADEGKLL